MCIAREPTLLHTLQPPLASLIGGPVLQVETVHFGDAWSTSRTHNVNALDIA